MDSESNSDTIAIMFNLDKLNETHPEFLQSHGWDKGCILEGGLDLTGEIQVMGLH